MRLLPYFGLLLLLVVVSGCTPWVAFVDSLNTRNLSSCISYRGHAGPYVTVRGLTVMGGASWETCAKLLPGGLE